MRWQQRAACRGLSWLMDPGPDPDRRTVRMARALCRTQCPVQIECLSWALSLTDENDPGGIAGGFDEVERRGLRVEMRGSVTSEDASDSASDLRECGIKECQTRLPEWIGAA